ncbi:MAG: BlaI/MecI/CopY family transcriptional regulator [Alistipes sp.]|jgi:predicted transcriptional regulator|nr:BlaI/MecI/CopY family transcriptional regulator [Alistipes sp.]
METTKNTPKQAAQLTRAELEIMQTIWTKGRARIHDILADMSEPRPAYNTVSTIVRILEQKGLVAHTAYGRVHEYYALLDRDDYAGLYMTNAMGYFFGGSPVQMVSFMSKRENISVGDLDSIIGILEEVKRESGGKNRNIGNADNGDEKSTKRQVVIGRR